jgi:hypothetical protein
MKRNLPSLDEAMSALLDRAKRTLGFIDERGAVSGDTPPWGDTHCHIAPSLVARDHYGWADDPANAEPAACRAEPVFLDAAWELCLQGILRPGVWHQPWQEIGYGAGRGYCITPFGRKWLASEARANPLPADPDHLSMLLSTHGQRFGERFVKVSTEAYNCYRFGCHIASRAMTEAAFDEIVRTTMERRDQKGAANPSVDRFLQGLKPELRTMAKNLLAQPHERETDRAAAFISLFRLIEFAQFVEDNWDEFTSVQPKAAVHQVVPNR